MIVYKSVMASEGSGSGVPVDSLTISKLPNKTFYLVGQDLNTDGLSITASVLGLSGDVTSYCSLSPTTFNTMGNTTITASLGGKSTTFDVKVAENLGTLEETAWVDIQAIASMGLGDQYWALGDTKSFEINYPYVSGYHDSVIGTFMVYIIDFNYNGDNGIYFQLFKKNTRYPYASFGTAGSSSSTYDRPEKYNMNHWGASNHGGWKGCDLRYNVLGSTDVPPSDYGSAVTEGRVGYDATPTCATNPVSGSLMSYLPSDMRAVMAPWTVYTDNVGNSTTAEENITASIDYLPLPSESQIFGSNTKGTNKNEITKSPRFAIYESSSTRPSLSRSTGSDDSYASWWCRTPHSNWAFVNIGTGGGIGASYASAPSGLCPCFRVA